MWITGAPPSRLAHLLPGQESNCDSEGGGVADELEYLIRVKYLSFLALLKAWGLICYDLFIIFYYLFAGFYGVNTVYVVLLFMFFFE